MKNNPSESSAAKKAKKKKGKKRKGPFSFLVIAMLLLIFALVLLRFSGIGAAPGSDSFKSLLDSTELMQNAKLVKQDLKNIASQIQENDITSLEFSSRKLDSDVADLKDYLSKPIWNIAEVVPVVGSDVKTARALVEVSETFSNDLLKSWVALQKEAPLTELKTEDGYRYELLPAYSAFLGENLPTIRSMLERLNKLDLRLVDDDGKITAYIKMATPLVQLADEHYSDLIQPGLALIAEDPPSMLKTEDGYDLDTIELYYRFLSDHLSATESAVREANKVDLSMIDMIDKSGKLSSYIKAAPPLLEIVDKYRDTLLDPGFALLSEHPLSSLKTDDGYDFEAISLYSDFLHDRGTSAEAMLEDLSAVDLSGLEKGEKIQDLVSLGRQLLEVAGPANENLLRPGLQLLAEHPFSSIKIDDGFDVKTILAYLDFVEECLPEIETLSQTLQSLDMSELDSSGKAVHYIEKLIELQALCDEYKEYIPAARVILGDGETDRFYLFPAQNSAEIRASGGFPGDVGSISIENGVLRIGSFISVYQAFSPYTSNKAHVTQQEIRLFTQRMYAPRDVDFCPDFERVGQIWAYAYEDQKKVHVDGIISATPIVVQKLLAAADASVELSNGMVLDGESATRILQRDLYFEYKSAGKLAYTDDDMTDLLFAETISKTMDVITSNLGPSTILKYVGVWKECIDERIIMLWMADPEEEDVMRQIGWSGSLNSDPNDPKLGLFFSSEQSSKMGYFFDMIPEIGEPTVNDDGSRTYQVTIKLNNVISKEEQRIGGTWILGRNYVGSIVGDLTVCAPAGGRIDDIRINIARSFWQETYQGLDVRFVQWLIIERNVPFTVTCTVTTAPGVETPLGIMSTPTCTNYR